MTDIRHIRAAIHQLRASGTPLTQSAILSSVQPLSSVPRAPSNLRLAVALTDSIIKSEHEKSCKHERSCKHAYKAWKREHFKSVDFGTKERRVNTDLGVMKTRRDGTVRLVGRVMHNAKGTGILSKGVPNRQVCDLGKARMACNDNDLREKEERDERLINLGRVLPKRTITL